MTVYLVNISATADLAATLAALAQHGTVSQPYACDRIAHVEGADGLRATLEAIPGVDSACHCDHAAHYAAIRELPPEQWAQDFISQDVLHFAQDHTGAGVDYYLADSIADITDPELGGRVTVIHNPNNDGVDSGHGHRVIVAALGTTYGVAPGALGFSAAAFPSATVAKITAALDAIGNHIIARQNALRPVVGMSFVVQGVGLANPFSAILGWLDGLGAHLIAAAGNGDGTTGFELGISSMNVWPAMDPRCITIGAHDDQGAVPLWSNFGPLVDLYAPGVNIATSWPGEPAPAIRSGTSYSQPYASGAACLAIEAGATDIRQWFADNEVAGRLFIPRETFTAPPPPPPPPPGQLLKKFHFGPSPEPAAAGANFHMR